MGSKRCDHFIKKSSGTTRERERQQSDSEWEKREYSLGNDVMRKEEYARIDSKSSTIQWESI